MAGAFFLLMAVIILTTYDGSIGRGGLSEPDVKEMELYELLDRRLAPGKSINNIVEEGERFIYEVSLKPLVLEDIHKTSAITSGCSFSGGTYAVIGKETGELVRNERISQLECSRCHNR